MTARVHLVQLLLPLYDNAGQAQPAEHFRAVSAALTERFGGLTAYTRAPATGLWQEEPGETVRDEVVVYEVMVDRLELEWWSAYRRELETRFRQEDLVIRAQEVRRL